MSKLQEIKDHLAEKYGWRNWDEMKQSIPSELPIEELALEFSHAVAEDALKRAAESAEMVFHCGHTKDNTTRRHYQIGADNLQVDKQSILSTPINIDL